jgi:hypothetical protein
MGVQPFSFSRRQKLIVRPARLLTGRARVNVRSRTKALMRMWLKQGRIAYRATLPTARIKRSMVDIVKW